MLTDKHITHTQRSWYTYFAERPGISPFLVPQPDGETADGRRQQLFSQVNYSASIPLILSQLVHLALKWTSAQFVGAIFSPHHWGSMYVAHSFCHAHMKKKQAFRLGNQLQDIILKWEKGAENPWVCWDIGWDHTAHYNKNECLSPSYIRPEWTNILTMLKPRHVQSGSGIVRIGASFVETHVCANCI